MSLDLSFNRTERNEMVTVTLMPFVQPDVLTPGCPSLTTSIIMQNVLLPIYDQANLNLYPLVLPRHT